MTSVRNFLIIAALLWAAAGLQGVLAPAMAIGPAHPDFVLVVICVVGLFMERSATTLTGFAGGAILGAITGAGMTSLTISRTLAAFGLASVRNMEIDSNVGFAAFACACTTAFASAVLLLMDPPQNLVSFGLGTIGMAIYNALLAIPLYALLSRVWRKSRF